MASMHTVIDAMVARLEAEFAGEDLGLCFDVFDIHMWSKVCQLQGTSQGDAGQKLEQALLRHCRRLCQALSLNAVEAAQHLRSAAYLLVREGSDVSAAQGAGHARDNRDLWSQTLQRQWWLSHGPLLRNGPTVVGKDSHLGRLVCFYLSVTDGTGRVERQLGSLLEILNKHDGPMDEDGKTASALMDVHLDGPQTESGMFTRADPGAAPLVPRMPRSRRRGLRQPPWENLGWQFTRFSRECAKLWVQLNGRRFASTYCKSARSKKRPLEGNSPNSPKCLLQ